MLFRPKGKTITKHLNFRISGERIKTSTTVKYLGVLLHEHLNWQPHIDSLVTKLSRAAGLLSKIRYYVPKFLLRTIYFSIFNSHSHRFGDKTSVKDKSYKIKIKL